MLRELHNEIRIGLEIEPRGPVLIKAGESLAAGIDMAFVRTFRGGREEVFLPGSSLKGLLRSHAERIGRTLQPEKICNIFNLPEKRDNPSPHGEVSCGSVLHEPDRDDRDRRNKRRRDKAVLSAPEAYKHSCPACRLFGSLAMGGRFNIDDAYVTGDPPAIEVRDGVGIDRFSGAAADKAKYQFEVISNGCFATTLTVRNFELWQVAWLALVLFDLTDGLLPIGMGTSRGLGRVTARITGLEIDILGRETPAEIAGIDRLYRGDGAETYGLVPLAPFPVPEGSAWLRRGLRHRLALGGQAATAFLETTTPVFAAFLDGYSHMTQWRAKVAGGAR